MDEAYRGPAQSGGEDREGADVTSKLNIIALWAGIIGAAAAIYFPVHSELIAERTAEAAEQKAQVERTAQAQKDWGLLLHRLSDDEAAIAFLETQMPKDKREMLRAIAQSQQQAMIQEQEASLQVMKKAQSKVQKGKKP
jgi:hypothetical protein